MPRAGAKVFLVDGSAPSVSVVDLSSPTDVADRSSAEHVLATFGRGRREVACYGPFRGRGRRPLPVVPLSGRPILSSGADWTVPASVPGP